MAYSQDIFESGCMTAVREDRPCGGNEQAVGCVYSYQTSPRRVNTEDSDCRGSRCVGPNRFCVARGVTGLRHNYAPFVATHGDHVIAKLLPFMMCAPELVVIVAALCTVSPHQNVTWPMYALDDVWTHVDRLTPRLKWIVGRRLLMPGAPETRTGSGWKTSHAPDVPM